MTHRLANLVVKVSTHAACVVAQVVTVSCGSALQPTSKTIVGMRFREPQPNADFAGLVAGAFAGPQTDSVGYIYNVDPGAWVLEYYFAEEPDRLIGRAPVVVRAGEMTIVVLVPTPL